MEAGIVPGTARRTKRGAAPACSASPGRLSFKKTAARMFLIPFIKKPDWRRPPVVTLLLILINVAVFVGFQRGDTRHYEQALNYYFESELPRIELPRYVAHVRQAGKEKQAARLTAALENDGEMYVLGAMQRDDEFMRALRAGSVVRAEEEVFETWQRQRRRFDAFEERLFTERYAFKSTRADPATFVTHMFLHGDWDHLFGNMLVLAIVGYIVEEVLGRKRYLGFYLASGAASILLYWTFHPDSDVSALGASGAISGVMAMYAVLFGLRRINFLYSLLFYFNIARAPAIVLLPVWLLNELYQLVFVPSNINYLAHIGGLLGGGALAGWYRYRHPVEVRDYHAREAAQEQAQRQYEEDMTRARQYTGNLEFGRALELYERWLRERPRQRELLLQCYRVARHKPGEEAFHRAAARILALNERDAETGELVHETFGEYLSLAKPAARLVPAQLLTLARRFSGDGHLDDADRLINALIRRDPGSSELPLLILRHAHAWQRAGDEAKATGWFETLRERFPHSDAARMAEVPSKSAADDGKNDCR
jgi:membrane associated rhomboid family serine protease